MSNFDKADDVVKFSFASTRQSQPGEVRFDLHGNAIYEWKDSRLQQDDQRAEKLRSRALAYAGLALIDNEPTANMPVIQNDKGLRVGYNPYESGLLAGKPATKRRTMQELSRWIELKRQLEQQTKK
jgi:hypothetical protein